MRQSPPCDRTSQCPSGGAPLPSGAVRWRRRLAAVSAIGARPRVWVVWAVLACAAGTGCARVKPYQREQLASPAMTVRFAEEGFPGEYRAKVVESKTGGGLPGDAPGGGCGCTQ
jgi:hypothetical protein